MEDPVYSRYSYCSFLLPYIIDWEYQYCTYILQFARTLLRSRFVSTTYINSMVIRQQSHSAYHTIHTRTVPTFQSVLGPLRLVCLGGSSQPTLSHNLSNPTKVFDTSDKRDSKIFHVVFYILCHTLQSRANVELHQ